ncbi:MAG: MFS transporter [Sphingomicrobium sp.]
MRLGARAQAGLLACGLFTTIGLFSPGLVLPQIERSFASTPHVEVLVQLIGAIASFTFAVGAPFAGALVSRLGCRRVILPSLILFAIAGTAPALLDDLWAILATRVVLGLSLSGIFTGGLAGIGAMPADVRARMFGWYSVVGGAAAIVLFPVVGLLARNGWHLPFVVHLLAAAVTPLVVLLPRTLGQVTRPVALAENTSSRGMFGPAMIGLLIMSVVVGMGMFIGPMYAPLYLNSLGITDTRLLAIPVTLGSIASVFASGSYGFLQRKLGIAGVSVVGMLTMAIALVVAGTAGMIPMFTAAIILHSATIALLAPHVSATALALSPEGKGSQAMGLANGVMFGSQLLFPFLASWIRAGAGITGVFLAFAGTALLIGLVILAGRGAARRRLAVA